MIEIQDLVVRYGSATALHGVSLRVHPQEMVALIGANGAGKSTLVNAISGILPAVQGRVRLGGVLAHVPEGRQLFGGLTVEDNLQLGAWRFPSRRRDMQWVFDLLPELERIRRLRADQLSGGQQQMIAVGRALMSRPQVLAIDELSLGLAPKVVATLAQALRDLNAREGTAVLLIEQNARLALSLCTRAYVLEAGKVVKEAAAQELLHSEFVEDAYLGRSPEELV